MKTFVKRVNKCYRLPMTLFIKKKSGKVVVVYSTIKNRILYNLIEGGGVGFKLKVAYSPSETNESVWYKTKKELMIAFRAFTEADLLKEFL